MDRANAETLAFVLPGLVHEFGNVLQTIQGQMLSVAHSSAGDAQRAVLQATTRGRSSLEILRWLLGDPAEEAGDPRALLSRIGELVRVPMRQAQHVLDLAPRAGPSNGPSSGPFAHVDSADFVILVVETLRQLVASVPKGVRGTTTLELAGAPGSPTVVSARFTAMAGDLPFPVPLAELQQALRLHAQRLGAAASCQIRGQAIAWEWHPRAVSQHHEA